MQNCPHARDIRNRVPGVGVVILKDTFLEAGSGDGFTSESDTPRQRIDYMRASPDLKASDFRIIQSTASDHFPVSVFVGR